MFLQGEILKSKERSNSYPKFVMVLYDKEPKETVFKAVVIFCKSAFDELSEDEEAGYTANNWDSSMWIKSSLNEIIKYL